jgi:hypothetical protein
MISPHEPFLRSAGTVSPETRVREIEKKFMGSIARSERKADNLAICYPTV